ncbi:MAG: hypothetical protein R2824_09945 [Saprospiraceae bacterium]|nr:hypothetical protein [Lewinella sp.]
MDYDLKDLVDSGAAFNQQGMKKVLSSQWKDWKHNLRIDTGRQFFLPMRAIVDWLLPAND